MVILKFTHADSALQLVRVLFASILIIRFFKLEGWQIILELLYIVLVLPLNQLLILHSSRVEKLEYALKLRMMSLLVNLRRRKINKLWYKRLFLKHLLLWYMLITFNIFFTVHHLKVLVIHSVVILGILLPRHLHVIQLVKLIEVILELLVHLNLLVRVTTRVGLAYADLLTSWII